MNGKVLEIYDNEQETSVNNKIAITSNTATITVDAKTKLVLVCGDSSITMVPDKITVSSPTIEVTGTKSAALGVGHQTVTCDTAQVAITGAGISSTTKGVHEITGSPVKLN